MNRTLPLLSLSAVVAALYTISALHAQDTINERLHAVFEKSKAKALAAGMSAQQLESIVGKPDNADWNQTFVFDSKTMRVWLCVDKRRTELKSWRDYVGDNRKFGLGFFFILAEDKLTSPVPALTSKDFNVLHNLATPSSGKAAMPPKP